MQSKVESQEGEGSTFHFIVQLIKLPDNYEFVQEIAQAEKSDFDFAIENLKGVQVLLVEDNEINRMVIADLLDNIEINEAEHGAKALEMLDDNEYDLVLLDIQMPVMNGLEFLQALRDNPSTSRTPTLMLTTETKAELKQQGKALGLTGWIVKPFNPAQLKQAITRVLRLPA